MKKLSIMASALLVLASSAATAIASPSKDLAEFQSYFTERFPDVPKADFINGVYSVDTGSREQWEAFEEFAPYEIFIEAGEELWNTPFANGKTFASCFGEPGVKNKYPHWDSKTQKVVSLEGDINACLEANGEKPYGWKKGKITHLAAYMAYETRGKTIDINVPSEPAALAAYERGKQHFWKKRGQLNMSCADCHYFNAGNRIRADILSPAIGQPSHFPVYRNKWAAKSKNADGMGSLHRRYGGCNKQVRAKPFKAQSDEYLALELFHTYMSNGLEWNGPGLRK